MNETHCNHYPNYHQPAFAWQVTITITTTKVSRTQFYLNGIFNKWAGREGSVGREGGVEGRKEGRLEKTSQLSS